MFTGIIEEVGTVLYVGGDIITIQAEKVLSDMERGASIAVNGVCLTVVEKSTGSFSAQISPETRARTTLSALSPQKKVNLERALSLNSRLGGHLVLGHVDGIGKVERIIEQGPFSQWYFRAPQNLCRYIVAKGSIAIDGISLTVVNIQNSVFSVAIIPTTRENTNLKYLRVGDSVNLETDIIAKYIEQFVKPYTPAGNISEDFLKEHGFLE